MLFPDADLECELQYCTLRVDDLTVAHISFNRIRSVTPVKLHLSPSNQQWFAPAPIDAWWRSCTINYSFGTFAEMLGRLHSLSGFELADRYVLWPVPKLKIELSRRNASTQGRKTDLVERYQHYYIAFFVRQLYYSFFSMNKGDHKLHNNKHSIS